VNENGLVASGVPLDQPETVSVVLVLAVTTPVVVVPMLVAVTVDPINEFVVKVAVDTVKVVDDVADAVPVKILSVGNKPQADAE